MSDERMLPPPEAFYAAQALEPREVWRRTVAMLGAETRGTGRWVSNEHDARRARLHLRSCECGKGYVQVDWLDSDRLEIDLSLRGAGLVIGVCPDDLSWRRQPGAVRPSFVTWREERAEFFLLRPETSAWGITLATLYGRPEWVPVFRALRKRKRREIKARRWDRRAETADIAVQAIARGASR